MRELKIITCQPNDLYFNWQLRVQLTNMRKYDLTGRYTALIRVHTNRSVGGDFNTAWKRLEKDFPEVNFVYYQDDEKLQSLILRFNYIPLLRPWLLAKYFQDHPELKNAAILYQDSDVIFTKKPDFSRLLDDDICYLSDTKSYIAASYFDSKIKDVLPEKVEDYKRVDILDDLLKEFGINRALGTIMESGSGGAQYLLKNITSEFWQDVLKGCILTRINLHSVNKRFFENEDKGFQVWCADMWSILFNLWRRAITTKCPTEMDFCWATDPIEKWDRVQFYHDAGAHTREVEAGHQLFHKRDQKYIDNKAVPFDEDLSFVSSKYCSYHYARAIEEARMTQYPIISSSPSTKVGEMEQRLGGGHIAL